MPNTEFSWRKVWEKGLKQFIYTGTGAAVPLVLTELSGCEKISDVNWLMLVDKSFLVFLVAAVGGAAGAVINWNKHYFKTE